MIIFSSLLAAMLAVFATAIAIYIGTRWFMGPRAASLPGGAMGFALIQGFANASQEWAYSAWVLVPLLLLCALVGHVVFAIAAGDAFRAKQDAL